MTLRLVDGGTKIGAATVRVRATCPAGALVVVEEDRWLALSARSDEIIPDSNPLRTHTRVLDAEPLPLGAVLERGGSLAAVVIDVDADPIVDLDAVVRAVSASAALARGAVLALPLFGVA